MQEMKGGITMLILTGVPFKAARVIIWGHSRQGLLQLEPATVNWYFCVDPESSLSTEELLLWPSIAGVITYVGPREQACMGSSIHCFSAHTKLIPESQPSVLDGPE